MSEKREGGTERGKVGREKERGNKKEFLKKLESVRSSFIFLAQSHLCVGQIETNVPSSKLKNISIRITTAVI